MNIYSKCPECGGDIFLGDELAEKICNLCGEKFITSRYCENGHNVCNKCLTNEYFKIVEDYCKSTKERDPIKIADQIMNLPESSLIDSKHAIVTYASVITAFKNSGGHAKDFDEVEDEIKMNTAVCPTEMCMIGASCVIPIAMGIAMRTVLDGVDKNISKTLSNNLTRYCEFNINNPEYGGSKDCCVRNTYLTIIFASKFIIRHLWADIEIPKKVKCAYSAENPRCSKEKCRFFYGAATTKQKVFPK